MSCLHLLVCTYLSALKRQASAALLGPRQVGKTTLALGIAIDTSALYLDLESQADRARLQEPLLFLEQFKDQLVIFDEIHRATDLFQGLRGVIDRYRREGRRTGHFLFLGSALMNLLRQASRLPVLIIRVYNSGLEGVLGSGGFDAEEIHGGVSSG